MASSSTPALPDVSGIACRFAIPGEVIEVSEIPTGHINITFRVGFRPSDGESRHFLLQSLNAHVFPSPRQVMENVGRVTRHLATKPGRSLRLIPAVDGADWVEENGRFWRCYEFFEGCVTYDVVERPAQAYQAAWAFGDFQRQLADFDASSLHETIPAFHDTPRRFARLSEVAAADPCGRLSTVTEELECILSRSPLAHALANLTDSGDIPIRVTHNDTKINNVLLDAASGEAVCVIDLDTVMPGLALYDFGDLVRSAVSLSAEDATDLSRIAVRRDVFEALVRGYLAGTAGALNHREVSHLVTAAKVMTLEVAIRFLTDHLEGDVYFKTHRPDHNLDRCRAQLALVERLEEAEPELTEIVEKARRG